MNTDRGDSDYDDFLLVMFGPQHVKNPIPMIRDPVVESVPDQLDNKHWHCFNPEPDYPLDVDIY